MSTSDSLRTRYFANNFVDLLRTRLILDTSEWESLKECINELALEWRGATQVDKDLVQDLYVLPTIIRGVADRIEESEDERAREIRERATELDALILEALSG